MPPEIERLVKDIQNQPLKVEVTPVSRTAETIEQKVCFVDTKNRVLLLADVLSQVKRGIVFTKMKHVANRIAEHLVKQGIGAEAFHSNKSQGARQRILASFKGGKTPILVATDIAARGLDVDDVELVVNFDLPDVAETYVHRIGRAGRAGKVGQALSLVDEEQRTLLQEIEKITKCKPTIVSEHAFVTASSQNSERKHVTSRLRGHGAVKR
jgi:ATP-dependent RNA helicase RhlE